MFCEVDLFIQIRDHDDFQIHKFFIKFSTYFFLYNYILEIDDADYAGCLLNCDNPDFHQKKIRNISLITYFTCAKK